MSDTSLSKRFGLTVRKRRSEAGLSQERLAELAQIHPTYVSLVERGVRNPTLEVAYRIAKALKIDLPKLIEEAEQQKKPRARIEVTVSHNSQSIRRRKPAEPS